MVGHLTKQTVVVGLACGPTLSWGWVGGWEAYEALDRKDMFTVQNDCKQLSRTWFAAYIPKGCFPHVFAVGSVLGFWWCQESWLLLLQGRKAWWVGDRAPSGLTALRYPLRSTVIDLVLEVKMRVTSWNCLLLNVTIVYYTLLVSWYFGRYWKMPPEKIGSQEATASAPPRPNQAAVLTLRLGRTYESVSLIWSILESCSYTSNHPIIQSSKLGSIS